MVNTKSHYQELREKFNILKDRCGVNTVHWLKGTKEIRDTIISIPGFSIGMKNFENWDNIFDLIRHEQACYQVPYFELLLDTPIFEQEMYYGEVFYSISSLNQLKEKRNDILFSLNAKNIVQLHDYYIYEKMVFHENYSELLVDYLGVDLKEAYNLGEYSNCIQEIMISQKSLSTTFALSLSVAHTQTMGWCLSIIEKIGGLIELGVITNQEQVDTAMNSMCNDLLYIAINYPISVNSKFITILIDFGGIDDGIFPYIKDEGMKYDNITSELLFDSEVFDYKPESCSTEKADRVHRGCPFAFFKPKKGKGNLLFLVMKNYLEIFKNRTLVKYYPNMFQKM